MTTAPNLRLISNHITAVEGIPPKHDERLESSIVGFAMTHPHLVRSIAVSVRPEHFYVGSRQWAWRAVKALLTSDQVPDISSVATWLETRQRLGSVAGIDGLEEMVHDGLVISARDGSGIQTAASQLVDLWRTREAGELGAILFRDAHRDVGDVDGFLGANIDRLRVLAQSRLGPAGQSSDESIAQLLFPSDGDEARADADVIPLGFPRIEETIGGLTLGHSMVIGARPGAGKTAFAIMASIGALEQTANAEAIFFSLEMPRREIQGRMIAQLSGIPFRSVMRPSLRTDEERTRIAGVAERVRKLNARLHIVDTKTLTIDDIRTQTAILMAGAKGRVVLVGLDYLTKVPRCQRTERLPAHEHTADVMMGFANMVGELRVAGLALAQLNRAIDGRIGKAKRPVMSDLGASAAIEHYAQSIGILWHPEKDARGNPDKGHPNITFVKTRQGCEGDVDLEFHGSTMRFWETRVDY